MRMARSGTEWHENGKKWDQQHIFHEMYGILHEPSLTEADSTFAGQLGSFCFLLNPQGVSNPSENCGTDNIPLINLVVINMFRY